MSADFLPKLIFLSPEVEEYLKTSLYSEVKFVNGKVVPPVFFFLQEIAYCRKGVQLFVNHVSFIK